MRRDLLEGYDATLRARSEVEVECAKSDKDIFMDQFKLTNGKKDKLAYGIYQLLKRNSEF